MDVQVDSNENYNSEKQEVVYQPVNLDPNMPQNPNQPVLVAPVLSPGQNLAIDQEDARSYAANLRMVQTSVRVNEIEPILPFLMDTLPIPQPIPMEKFDEELDPMDKDKSNIVFSDAVYDKLNLDHLIRDPRTVLEPYQSIQLTDGYDVEDFNLRPARWQLLVLGPKTNDADSSKYLFSAVEHVEPYKNCCQRDCCCCCYGCCSEVFLWQVNYRFKNQNFASIYKSAKCPSCYACRSFCCECCEKHYDISKVRITKYPRLDYMKASKLLGKTGISTNCCAKCCGDDFCCGACDPGRGIDYYDETNKRYKYRLGFPKRRCGAGCSYLCQCFQCNGSGICSSCYNCCGGRARRGLDYYALILDLEKRAITGYIVLKRASVGIFPPCCSCKVPEFYYPNVHIEIVFPVDATGLDKFMILNLVICWYYRAPMKRLYFPLYSFIDPQSILEQERPTEEDMKLFVD